MTKLTTEMDKEGFLATFLLNILTHVSEILVYFSLVWKIVILLWNNECGRWTLEWFHICLMF